jgi:hypothetical protein
MIVLTVLNIIGIFVTSNKELREIFIMLLLTVVILVGWILMGTLVLTKDKVSYFPKYYSTEVPDGIYIKDNTGITRVITDKKSYVNWKSGNSILKVTQDINVYGWCVGSSYKIILKED